MSKTIIKSATLRGNSTAATVVEDFATVIAGIVAEAEKGGLTPVWDRLEVWTNVDRDESRTYADIDPVVSEYRTLNAEVLAITKEEAKA